MVIPTTITEAGAMLAEARTRLARTDYYSEMYGYYRMDEERALRWLDHLAVGPWPSCAERDCDEPAMSEEPQGPAGAGTPLPRCCPNHTPWCVACRHTKAVRMLEDDEVYCAGCDPYTD